MVASRRSVGIAVVALLLVAAVVVGYAALIGLESSFLPERMTYFQRAASVVAASTARSPSSELPSQGGSNVSVPAMVVNENSTNATISSKDSKSAPAAPVNVDAEGQKANVIKSQDSNNNSTAVGETARDSKVLAANGVNEATLPPEWRSREPEPTRTNDLDELMTSELIQKIESQENNCLSPIQVHLIWIGDINEAPNYRFKYTAKGYNLTLQTSAEEILEGFHPYVLKAYRQAIPKVVGFDFLKFAILYKYGGFAVDADTEPVLSASELQWPSDCELIFGKEASAPNWEKPVFRKHGGPTYGLTRPFQILNWAMAVSKPRNHHIKWFLQTAMMHFLGLRDMNLDLVQDISGSGLMTDYVALLHEREGRSIQDVYNDHSRYFPVQGLCLTDGHMHGKWIKHAFLGSWKQAEP